MPSPSTTSSAVEAFTLYRETVQRWKQIVADLDAAKPVEQTSVADASEAMQTATQALHAIIFKHNPKAKWRTQAELKALAHRVDADNRQSDAAQKLSHLAELLATVHIWHRLDRVRLHRSALRDAAAAELKQASKHAPAIILPGPSADQWLNWAFSLRSGRDDHDLEFLAAHLPSLERFVGEPDLAEWRCAVRQGLAQPPAAEPIALVAAPARKLPQSALPESQESEAAA